MHRASSRLVSPLPLPLLLLVLPWVLPSPPATGAATDPGPAREGPAAGLPSRARCCRRRRASAATACSNSRRASASSSRSSSERGLMAWSEADWGGGGALLARAFLTHAVSAVSSCAFDVTRAYVELVPYAAEADTHTHSCTLSGRAPPVRPCCVTVRPAAGRSGRTARRAWQAAPPAAARGPVGAKPGMHARGVYRMPGRPGCTGCQWYRSTGTTRFPAVSHGVV